MTRDLKREQEEFRDNRAQRIYDYTDEEFKTRNKNHPELPTNCYLKGFDAYESSPKFKAMIETLKFESDCGDNSCRFAKKRGQMGMRTNGGCRCIDKNPRAFVKFAVMASALLKEIGEG